jgi:hypothetical protein
LTSQVGLLVADPNVSSTFGLLGCSLFFTSSSGNYLSGCALSLASSCLLNMSGCWVELLCCWWLPRKNSDYCRAGSSCSVLRFQLWMLYYTSLILIVGMANPDIGLTHMQTNGLDILTDVRDFD